MLTFKDYKVRVKKILNVLMPGKIRVETYRYKGFIIYEDLYGFNGFYYQSKKGWAVSGRYQTLIESIDNEPLPPSQS